MLYSYLIHRYNIYNRKREVVAVSDFEKEADEMMDLFATQSFCRGDGNIYSVEKVIKPLYSDFKEDFPERVLVSVFSDKINRVKSTNSYKVRPMESGEELKSPYVDVVIKGNFNVVSLNFVVPVIHGDRVKQIVDKIYKKYEFYMDIIKKLNFGFNSLKELEKVDGKTLKILGFSCEGKRYRIYLDKKIV